VRKAANGNRDAVSTRKHPEDTDRDAAADEAAAAGELYTLAPAEFTAARDERVKALRGAGRRASAARVAGLRRPVLSAWLVNLLVREHGDEIDAFLTLGEAMREAQHESSGPRLRELSDRRRRAVDALERRARTLAGAHGHASVDADTVRDVRDTLAAALADPAAARTLAQGTLTHPLHPGDPTTDTTAPATNSREPAPTRNPHPESGAKGGANRARDKDRRERERRETELAHAHTAVEQTGKAARAAREQARALDADLDSRDSRSRAAAARVDDLEQQLTHARDESDRLAGELRRARREHERVDKHAEKAERAAHDAREHLDHLRR